MADPILPTACDFHCKYRDLLHAANLRHGTDGFTSPTKEGMLRTFYRPRTWVPEASMLTTRPLKPLIKGRRRKNNPDLEVPVLVTRRAKPIRIGGVLLYIKTDDKIEIKSDHYKATLTKYRLSSFP
jgi:hypothetical protein